MMDDETDKIVKELFESLLERYQKGLEESMKGSEFVFDSVDLLEYKLNKIVLHGRGSYLDSPKWLKKKQKKTIIIPKNHDDKCFQYAVTAALNYQNIKKNPQRISNMKPFIDQYDWKEINFPSYKEDWKKFELNNKSFAVNTLFVPYNIE